ncbi:hypothetical protein EAG_10152 [Camponotus floridanus]|uniref:Uncharacterized protein n=1 Tax=Camponotus floridanus TaxID=104421 RepID=E2AJZ9_CAMFO|nr:hypothetical protein EAG_10152 [Camponotus floridanus]
MRNRGGEERVRGDSERVEDNQRYSARAENWKTREAGLEGRRQPRDEDKRDSLRFSRPRDRSTPTPGSTKLNKSSKLICGEFIAYSGLFSGANRNHESRDSSAKSGRLDRFRLSRCRRSGRLSPARRGAARRHAGVRERALYRRGFVPGREPVARRYRGKLRRRQAPVDDDHRRDEGSNTRRRISRRHSRVRRSLLRYDHVSGHVVVAPRAAAANPEVDDGAAIRAAAGPRETPSHRVTTRAGGGGHRVRGHRAMLDLKSSGTTAAELPRTTAFTNLSMLFAGFSDIACIFNIAFHENLKENWHVLPNDRHTPRHSRNVKSEAPLMDSGVSRSNEGGNAGSSYKGGWSHATSPAPGQDACPHGGNAEEQTPPCVDANTELAQSSRGDHRDLPAGIFVINGFWPRQPGYNNRGVVRDYLRGARGHKFRLRTRVNACEHECPPCPYSRLYSGSAQPAVSHLLALGFKQVCEIILTQT